MTPRERMLSAIGGAAADRVPFTTYDCHPRAWGPHAGAAEYRPILEAVARTGAAVLCKVRPECTGSLPAPEVAETAESGERISVAVLHTPAGPLRRVLRKPPDQPARCVEPYLESDEDIDLRALRQAAAGGMTLMGYVQDRELYTLTTQQVRRHVAEMPAPAAGEARFVASPTCTPFSIPPPRRYVANYVAFLEAVAELGARGRRRHTFRAAGLAGADDEE